jgi:threonine synthase
MKMQQSAQGLAAATAIRGLDGPDHPAVKRYPVADRQTDPAARNRVYDSIADLVADPDHPTPLVRLSKRFNPEPDLQVYVKLEGFNPFGSIKDRVALYLLRGTPLAEGQVIAEPTAGNTGIALAALANASGQAVELAVSHGRCARGGEEPGGERGIRGSLRESQPV